MIALIRRYLFSHPLRSLLTMSALGLALLLFCFLATVLTTLEAGVKAANSRRLWVQSAVSLFVDLPLNYQPKIDDIPGVDRVCKFQWFGGYYQEPGNFFAQFAVDPDAFFDMYPEIEIIAGSMEDVKSQKTHCLIGKGLSAQFGWKLGDKIPITGGIFPRSDGQPWEFVVGAIYDIKKPCLDDRTLFFHWDYFEKTMEADRGAAPDVGTYLVQIPEGADPVPIMAAIDGLFFNGPQRVQTTTESEFQRQFVGMVGGLPTLISAIGSVVMLAILLGTANTMLMAFREQTRQLGILKALGFSDLWAFGLLMGQSLILCSLGGGMGIALSAAMEPGISAGLNSFFPGYAVQPATYAIALGSTLAVGLLSGIVPAWNARRLKPIESLRAEI